MTDVLNISAGPSGQEPEGHMQAMLDAVDRKEQEIAQATAPTKDQPEKLLGKFENVEELAKAYTELERKLGSRQPDQNTAPLTEETALAKIEQAGLDLSGMESHWLSSGELSEDHYTALENNGIPRAFVDQYLEGLSATVDKMREDIAAAVGGKEQWEAMAEWAKTNLSDADLNAYNQAVSAGDPHAVQAAVMGLAYRWQQAEGRNPSLVGGHAGSAPQGFASVAQMTEAMGDPRYAKDPAYRAEVERRLAASSIF